MDEDVNILEQVPLHCDEWYFPNVCPSRTTRDLADIRKDKDGFIKPHRYICNTNGQSPLYEYSLCRHCVEIKKLFKVQKLDHHGKVNA